MSQAKIKKNNYGWGILFASCIGLGFSLMMLLLFGTGNTDLPGWLIDLLFGSTLVLNSSRIVSGVGYICRGIDTITNEKTIFDACARKNSTEQSAAEPSSKPFRRRINGQFIGIAIGVTFGIAATVIVATLHLAKNILGGIFSFIGQVALLAGFGNRLGRVVDYFRGACKKKTNKPDTKILQHKEVNYTLGVVGGVLLGAALAAVMIATSAVTFGSSLAAGIFALGILGNAASAGGYIGIIFGGFLRKRTLFSKKNAPEKSDEKGKSLLNPQPKPIASKGFTKTWKGTLIGAIAGAALGALLIGTGLFTLPFFGLGAVKLWAGIAIMGICISNLAGWGNRLGTAAEQFTATKKEKMPGATEVCTEAIAPSSVDRAVACSATSPSHNSVNVRVNSPSQSPSANHSLSHTHASGSEAVSPANDEITLAERNYASAPSLSATPNVNFFHPYQEMREERYNREYRSLPLPDRLANSPH